jgi:hypothetical protein
MGYITEVDAVNHMLLMAGESTVSDLSTDTSIDTETARTLLDQYTHDFLMRGIVGNRQIKKYNLDAAGKIEFISGSTNQIVLTAELVSVHHNTDNYKIQTSVRGNTEGSNGSDAAYLYNVTDQTSTWDAKKDYWVELLFHLDWDELDTAFQRAIMAAAARQYQIIMQGDADADAYLANAEAFYAAKAKASNTDIRQRSLFAQVPIRSYDAVSRSSRHNDPNRFRFWRHS